MEFKDSESRICIARAFAGLCQDGARYQLMKKSAESEGYGALALLFATFAKHKMAHASALYKIMTENMKCRKDNVPIDAGYPFESYKLSTSIAGSGETEAYEGNNLFPHFAKLAHDEGYPQIEKLFIQISKVCLNFAEKLKSLSSQFENKKLYKSEKPTIWHCTNCGHEEEGKSAWNSCPLCSYPQGYVQPTFKED